MQELEKELNYRFEDKMLLQRALTHSSYANEHKDTRVQSNERLEFLGDSVLGMVVADALFRGFPGMPEGDLTRTRAALVCEESLVRVAAAMGLGRYLRLGKGEEAGGGRERPSILADAAEALIAALYLDGGIAQARRTIRHYLLENAEERSAGRDFKTALQERVQVKKGQTLAYRLLEESGPDHAKCFSVEVTLNGTPIGSGAGKSKKEAEQNAAREALEKLTK